MFLNWLKIKFKQQKKEIFAIKSKNRGKKIVTQYECQISWYITNIPWRFSKTYLKKISISYRLKTQRYPKAPSTLKLIFETVKFKFSIWFDLFHQVMSQT